MRAAAGAKDVGTRGHADGSAEDPGTPVTPRAGRPLLVAALAAIGASLCCVVPFVLLALGIGGAWLAGLRALAPYRPLFVAAVLVFLGLAFHRLYVAPRRCADGELCATPAVLRRQRLIFWLVSAALLGLVAFPWYGPVLLG